MGIITTALNSIKGLIFRKRIDDADQSIVEEKAPSLSGDFREKLFVSANIEAREVKRTYIRSSDKQFFNKKKTQFKNWNKWKKTR